MMEGQSTKEPNGRKLRADNYNQLEPGNTTKVAFHFE